jgi:hypothetical protein
MPPDPGKIFGNLLAGCISEVYNDQDKKTQAEAVVFVILGATCSVATTYILSFAGVFV